MTDVTEEEVVFGGEGSRGEVLGHGFRLLEGNPRAAAAQAREILAADPGDRTATLLLCRALRRLGEERQAAETEQALVEGAGAEPGFGEAAQAIGGGRLRDAEVALRALLGRFPDDPVALRMLADVAWFAGAQRDSLQILEQAVALAPSYRSARLRLAKLLIEGGQVARALDLLGDVVEESDSIRAVSGHAAALSRVGEYDHAARLYERLIAAEPDNAGLWMSLGHLRNTLGQTEGSIAAYREALARNPADGTSWWSLANLKTFRFTDADVAAMEDALARGMPVDEEIPIRFALGKAWEDRREASTSFAHYAAGNRLRKEEQPYDPALVHDLVEAWRPLLAEGAPSRNPAPGPIFVLGMPRAGSTLIEQILASHSAIEGTAELPVMPLLVRELEEKAQAAYPGLLTGLDGAALADIGRRYLEGAAVHRKTDRPFFIDKLPNNWLHVGLIARALPNARIIDARRHPLDCGWSLFKQNFARGQGFSYDLADIGHYYRDYVRLMAAVDAAMPGRVHRVIHERLVDDSEAEIRAMLDYVGVPFEEGVLRHHENDRAVRTPSAAQVRKPINREGMERWRPFEPWLGPLKDALGDVLECYPEVPKAL